MFLTFCLSDNINEAQALTKTRICTFNHAQMNEGINSIRSFSGKKTSDRIFNGKELYDHMNGGADAYLNAGCTCVWVKQFEGPGQQYAVIGIYEFADLAGLNLIYTNNAGDQDIKIGDQGSYSGTNYLVFRHNNLLCRILFFNKNKTNQIIELGQNLEKILEEKENTGKDSANFNRNVTEMKKINSEHIIVIGASYAKGWEPNTLLGMKVLNKGIGGEQSGEMLTRFNGDVIANKPKVVIIWGFINDLFRCDRAQVDATIEKIKRHFEEMVDLARQNGISPILATEVTIRGKDGLKEMAASLIGKILGKQSYQSYINEKVVAVNQWLINYAKKNDIILLDFQTVLSNQKGSRKKAFATPDGSHISMEGYNALTDYVQERLKNYDHLQ